MAGSLESFFQQQRQRGVQLTGAAKKQLTKAIQQKGKEGQGKKITAAELKRGKKQYAKSGGEDYLATVGRTYQANQLAKNVRNRLTKAGFSQDAGGYYTKAGPITGSALDKALSSGYDPQDVRSYLAGAFAQNELDDQISKFLGEGGQYKLDPSSGRWSKQELTPGDNLIPGSGGVTGGTGIYGGINPDAAPGATPAEFDYSMIMDPAKLEAKSRERLGMLQAGTSAYLGRLQAGSNQAVNRMQTASSERQARLQAQAEKDITRSQQAAELLGRKMGYGTEYDIAKMNRLAGLQQANIQQATNLYNLIPSAF